MKRRQPPHARQPLTTLLLLSLLFILQACSSGGGSAPSYTVGGTISGLTGSLTLQNNGSETLTLSTNGDYSFTTRLNEGTSYNITIQNQPEYDTCTVSNGSGVVAKQNITISISCQLISHTIGGSVSGLTGSLTLQNNGSDNLQINTDGTFQFTQPITHGNNYNVTVLTQPDGQGCTLSNSSGSANNAITTVQVNCIASVNGTGYYNQGGINVNNNTLIASDAQIIIRDNRMFIVSLSNWLLYEAELNIVGDRFTGNATIYTNAIKTGETTVSGTLSKNSQIIGQFEGSGVGQGTFTATYAPANINGNTADFSKVSYDSSTGPYWKGDLSEPSTEYLFVLDQEKLDTWIDPRVGTFARCSIYGDAYVVPDSALYEFALSENPLVSCTNTAINGTILTGYGVVTTAANDRFLMILTGNGYAAYDEFRLGPR